MEKGTKRKQATLLFIIAMLVTFCLGVGLSYAYFSDSKSASNTLSFGKLKIATNASSEVNLTLTGNTSDASKKLAPNDTVTITGSIGLEDNSVSAYIRMKMDVYEKGTKNKIDTTFKSLFMEEMAKIKNGNKQWFKVGQYLYLGNQIVSGETFDYNNEITLTEGMIPEELQGKDIDVVMEYQAIQSAGMNLTLTGYTQENATSISGLEAWSEFSTEEEKAQIELEKQSIAKLKFEVLDSATRTIKIKEINSNVSLGNMAIPKYVKYNSSTGTFERANGSDYKSFTDVYMLTEIGTKYYKPEMRDDGLFSEEESLTSIILPNSLTRIQNYEFWRCTNLTSITIPDSVTSIGDSAFGSCSSLTSIMIPDSVTSIGYSAFDSCKSLTSITIPNSITSIGYSAFYGCSSLTSITIGSGVTSIGSYAFYGCSSLTTINYNGTVAQWGSITGVSSASIRTGVVVECTDGNITI